MKIDFVIHGQPYSKANRRKMVYVGKAGSKRPMFIKSKEARTYEDDAMLQLIILKDENDWQMIEEDCAITITIYYASRRPDLDPSIILDVLQKAEIVKNDRLFTEMHLYKAIDKEKPRAEICIHDLTVSDNQKQRIMEL